MSLDEMEKYCLALIIINGSKIDYHEIKDIILEYKEDFSRYEEKYLKYTKIKKSFIKFV